MLLRFKVKNYRSIREEAVLDMEAAGLGDRKECLLTYKNSNYLPVVSINGKNGGGKSNVIRAMWLAVQFINNAQRTQHENADVPVTAFELDDYSKSEPTAFEFEYVCDEIRYIYGFSANRKEIVEEHLYWTPKGQLAKIFERHGQKFTFPSNAEKKLKEMISQAVAPNQLFFAISCTMNYQPCISAMKWFRTKVFFSRDYSDLGKNIIEYGEDHEMLKSISDMAKLADVGISDIKFEINNVEISSLDELERVFDQEQIQKMSEVLAEFKKNLQMDTDGNSGTLKVNELKTTSFHNGIKKDGTVSQFPLGLEDESDGTIKIMARAAAIEEAIRENGVFVVDEIENRLHPKLVEYIIKRFQNQETGRSAQLIFTTHSTDILTRELLRRDQYYFVDKDSKSGGTELYSLTDFSPRNDERIGKAYLLGKYGAIPFIMEG